MPTFKYETLLKKILEERDISYSIFSKMTGVPKSSMFNYINGIRKPDIFTAVMIWKFLGLPATTLPILFEPC